MAPLSHEQVRQGMAKLQGWTLEGNELRKKFKFESFMPGIKFVNKIAEAAEAAGHHPDITINYNVVGIALSTHSEGGITNKDLELASSIDNIHQAPS